VQMKVAVTGRTGFLGKRYLQVPVGDFVKVPLDLRRTGIADIGLQETDVAIHLAGMAHDMQRAPDEEYLSVNFDLIRALAIRAKSSGIRQSVLSALQKCMAMKFPPHWMSILHVSLLTPTGEVNWWWRVIFKASVLRILKRSSCDHRWYMAPK
jgi:nucleoside-diphosphate-sugar epimerase